MKRLLAIGVIFFTVVTFLGTFYVLYNHGEPGAGYAIIPMLITVSLLTIYRNK